MGRCYLTLAGEVGDHKAHFTDKYLSKDFEKWLAEGPPEDGFKFRFAQ